MAPKKSEPLKPGQKSPVSGQGEVVGPRGGRTGHEVTLIQGHRVPPTQKPGQKVVVVDPTKNGAGKPK
ncbi:hypothetical protein [Gordonia sp. CNJ-863]|uniref:hypothetical protein n=1 Tax=Gordonia sp. CNJ-863 TaxID=1904963 RepID=UPI00096A2EF1|nr:hypothetical protein [Gordonia sp. CNJ-863]